MSDLHPAYFASERFQSSREALFALRRLARSKGYGQTALVTPGSGEAADSRRALRIGQVSVSLTAG